MRDRYLALPVEEIAGDPAVRKMGMRMFANNCAQCHGADAKGSLRLSQPHDDDWIFGGDPAHYQGHAGQWAPGGNARLG